VPDAAVSLPCRYHKGRKAWFQRTPDGWHDVGKEQERGEYMYFDVGYEQASTAWVHRIKSDFTFQYDQLENDIPALHA
jgi:CCR4-NOT transcriptional regulation complex NOT5 subunit